MNDSNLPPLDVLQQNVICKFCGYNLRGLRRSSYCPECGKQISESLKGNQLINANPQWLAKCAVRHHSEIMQSTGKRPDWDWGGGIAGLWDLSSPYTSCRSRGLFSGSGLRTKLLHLNRHRWMRKEPSPSDVCSERPPGSRWVAQSLRS